MIIDTALDRVGMARAAARLFSTLSGGERQRVGDRTAAAIDAGGVWPAFTGVLVRDGYGGYAHLTGAVHAWCGAHLLRDLRAVAEGDPAGQVWADALATTLLDAHHAACAVRHAGQAALTPEVLGCRRSARAG